MMAAAEQNPDENAQDRFDSPNASGRNPIVGGDGVGDDESDQQRRQQQQRLLEEEIERQLLAGLAAAAEDDGSEREGDQQGTANGRADAPQQRPPALVDEHGNIVPPQQDDFPPEIRLPGDDDGEPNAILPPNLAVGANNAAGNAASAGLRKSSFFLGLSYPQLSFGLALGLFYFAMRTRQQFFLAMVYLSSSKLSLAVYGNFCIALATSLFDAFTSLFLEGGLRLQEAEGLQDFFRWNVTETCLALTMFRSELTVRTTVEFLVLIWIKCAHHVASLRESHFRMTTEAIHTRTFWSGRLCLPVMPMALIRLWTMLLVLQLLDVSVFQYTSQSLDEDGPSVNILFKFETVILLVAAWKHTLLLYLHVLDGVLHYVYERHFWLARPMLRMWKEHRATLVFAVELQAQAFQFLFYLAFFGTVLTFYGMPINLFRELYVSFAALKERVGAFLKYRSLVAGMAKFPDATDEQLDGDAGRTCIICRDEMRSGGDSKQLSPGCGHIFHTSCLREWLVQQQTCPTCRADIGAASRVATAVAAARQRQQVAEQEQQQHAQQQQAAEQEQQQQQHGDAEPQQVAEPPAAPVAGRGDSGAAEAVQAERPSKATPVPAARERSGLAAADLDAGIAPTAAAASLPPLAVSSSSPSSRAVYRPTGLFESDGVASLYFPSLWRVVNEEGTAVWDFDGREGRTKLVEAGSERGAGGCVSRVLSPGTVVLCTGVYLDDRDQAFLRVPRGWIPREDAVLVADVVRA
jgi:E3 ubiquitin-protein ligase synoviolin